MSVFRFVVMQAGGDGSEDFVGKLRIVDGARDDEGTDEARVGGERLLTASTGGVALYDAAQVLKERTEFVGEDAANRVALPRDLWTERRHGAAPTGAVAMFRREVGAGERFEGVAC